MCAANSFGDDCSVIVAAWLLPLGLANVLFPLQNLPSIAPEFRKEPNELPLRGLLHSGSFIFKKIKIQKEN